MNRARSHKVIKALQMYVVAVHPTVKYDASAFSQAAKSGDRKKCVHRRFFDG